MSLVPVAVSEGTVSPPSQPAKRLRRMVRDDFNVIRQRMRQLYSNLLKGEPLPYYTHKQIRYLTRVCEFIFRVYDKPKSHVVLMMEREEPRIPEEERIERWCRISDKELIILKPLMPGTAVNLEHYDNEENKRPQIDGSLRKTYGIVVRT